MPEQEQYIKLSEAQDVIGGYCSSVQDTETLLYHLGQLDTKQIPEEV